MMGMDKNSESTELQLDALQDALGVKIKDREGFVTALRALCMPEAEMEDKETEDKPMPKGKGPSIAVIMGAGPPKKG